MKITAVASSGPIRESALLMAEARPEFRDGTDVISAVVRGATSSEMPPMKRFLVYAIASSAVLAQDASTVEAR